MPRIVKVYDSMRSPPEWNRLLTGTEVAVFTEDAHSELPVDGDSGEPICEIFDNIESAVNHCRNLVAERPQLRCQVFDSHGRGGDPIAVYQSTKLRSREITGRFRRWFASTLIASSVLLIWLDWRSDFERMWPSILAWKLVTTALVFITWEAALLMQKFLSKRRQNAGVAGR
ncbi:MAG TPA: hypothetical protein VG498_00740 [Terriglobales bacterium]|nr:hypothetical protein [Terriglobales bacterium]